MVLREKYLIYQDHPICEKDYRVSGDKSVVMKYRVIMQGVGDVCTVCDQVIMDSVCTIEGVVMCEKDYKVINTG